MRFQNSAQASYPVPPGAFTKTAVDPTVKWATIREASSHSATLIPGENQLLKLHSLIISWTNIELAGELQIFIPDCPTIIIFQSAPSGESNINLYERVIALGESGIQVANNSDGGAYTITLFYSQGE